MSRSLNEMEKKIRELKARKRYKEDYFVPGLWLKAGEVDSGSPIKINPYDFFLKMIKRIRTISRDRNFTKGKWAEKAIIYNMFIRHSCAYDHNADGIISIDNEYFRETGTFAKAIAMLPYIASLGVNTIYLLPITSIGIDNKKGTLGSPYAIKNPFELDEMLAEPALGLGPAGEFSAFTEAAHLLGIRVIIEFVFRTASIDSDLALAQPEWFYWIKSNIKDSVAGIKNEKRYGPPYFSESELLKIKEKILEEDFRDLPAPHKVFREMFTGTPKKVARVGGKIRGVLDNGKECRIPSAFADWPPDDKQPVWSDVTYLRLYDSNDFNYIAYNTVRMYDEKLAEEDNIIGPLWENICNIIPHYQKRYGIDGVMIDMGHALPSELRAEIVKRARKRNKEFIFLEENFNITEKSANEGYDAVVGYMLFDQDNPAKMKKLIDMLAESGSPVPFFATPENHNTPRAASKEGGLQYSRFALAMNMLFPAIPFIHSGIELGERTPVNTGLRFTDREMEMYPAEKLPLFSEGALGWNNPNTLNILVIKLMNIREKYLDMGTNFYKSTFFEIECSNRNIIAFARKTKFKNKDLLFFGSLHKDKELYFELKLPDNAHTFYDISEDRSYSIINGGLIYNLNPYNYMIGEIQYE